MPIIREEGKINNDTTLIDVSLSGAKGICALFLIEGSKKTCIYDSGDPHASKNAIKYLKKIKIIPDICIVSHSHWDHSQGVPYLREYAADNGKKLEVMASAKAINNLEDQTWNKIFPKIPKVTTASITDVKPLQEGEMIDLGGIRLRVIDVPGHIDDHIAIMDEKNRNIFVGDSIGMKFGPSGILPPMMPPFWNPDSFKTTIEKLKELEYDTLCMNHFGYLTGNDAKGILDESLSSFETLNRIFDENPDKMNKSGKLIEIVKKELNLVFPIIRMANPVLNLATYFFQKQIQRFILDLNLKWLMIGYKLHKQSNT